MRSFLIGLLISTTILPTASISTAYAQTAERRAIKTVTLRIMRTVNGWVRIYDNGSKILLSVQQARDLGLSPTETIGYVVEVIAIDTWTDATQLASDIGVVSQYVAVDVAMPLLSDAYTYTGDVIIPKASEGISTAYSYSTNVIVPKASELAADAYTAAAPVVSGAADYTTDTILPAASDLAASGASATVDGAKSLWKWATE